MRRLQIHFFWTCPFQLCDRTFEKNLYVVRMCKICFDTPPYIAFFLSITILQAARIRSNSDICFYRKQNSQKVERKKILWRQKALLRRGKCGRSIGEKKKKQLNLAVFFACHLCQISQCVKSVVIFAEYKYTHTYVLALAAPETIVCTRTLYVQACILYSISTNYK